MFSINPSERAPRNILTIAASLQTYGAARSIVIDEHGTILAGNGLVEAAAQVGMENVRVIPIDGTEIIGLQISHFTREREACLT